jgi:hypothetical protein
VETVAHLERRKQGAIMKTVYLVTTLIFLSLCNTTLNSFLARDLVSEALKDFKITYRKILPEFDSKYNIVLDSTKIFFSEDLEEPVVGLCEFSVPRKITIDALYWSKATKTQRKLLMFHELGHCVFNREHKEDKYTDGCPKSIMSSVLMTPDCFYAHSKEITKELAQF